MNDKGTYMTRRPIYVGPLLTVLCLFAVVILFWPTFRDLLGIGGTGGEFTHRIFVIPIFFVIVWGLRDNLAEIPIRPFWLGNIFIAASGLLWLVGELSLIRIFTETAVMVMVPLAVLSVLGYRWLWETSFPLFFLLFAVPVRGPLVDWQVNLTAKFTHLGLLASGFPVHREGPFFEVPSGKWSIAEACSGIEYLSACMMFTVLFAWTMFNSTRKRVIFVIGGVLVGICGNWLRAYLTILIAHLSDNRFLRHGHGTFGWVMFAVLLFAYCWIGWRYRDREASASPVPDEHGNHRPSPDTATPQNSKGPMLVAAIVIGVMAAWPLVSHLYARTQPNLKVNVPALVLRAGWKAVNTPVTDWKPMLVNPSLENLQTFEKNGKKVGVFIGIFSNQTWNSKLVSSVNHFIAPESARWSLIHRTTDNTRFLGKSLDVKTGIILGDARIMARQWYWVHGVSTASDIQAKIEQLRARIDGRADISAWISVYATVDSTGEFASATLDEFMRDMGQSLAGALTASTQP